MVKLDALRFAYFEVFFGPDNNIEKIDILTSAAQQKFHGEGEFSPIVCTGSSVIDM